MSWLCYNCHFPCQNTISSSSEFFFGTEIIQLLRGKKIFPWIVQQWVGPRINIPDIKFFIHLFFRNRQLLGFYSKQFIYDLCFDGTDELVNILTTWYKNVFNIRWLDWISCSSFPTLGDPTLVILWLVLREMQVHWPMSFTLFQASP